MSSIAPHILEEVARWHARLAAPDCTDHERAGFARWRQQDPLHAQADALAKRASANIDHLIASDPRMDALAQEAFSSATLCPETTEVAPAEITRKKRVSRRWLIPAAVAAGLALQVLILKLWFVPSESEPVTFTTAARERGNVALADGSQVRIDVSTSLAVQITNHERSIELKRGRALFEVAPDPSRPFSVQVGNGRVVALGTRFQVQRDGDRVIVTLADGSILVNNQSGPEGPVHEERLVPGEQVIYALDASSWRKRKVDSDSATSWSRGRLIFRGTPLVEALDEVNRYASPSIRLGEASLAKLEISGTFAVDDSAAVAAALEAVLPVSAKELGAEGIVLLPR